MLEDEDFLYLAGRGLLPRYRANYAQYLNLDPDDAISYFEDLRGGVSNGQGCPGYEAAGDALALGSELAPIAFVVVISAVLFAWLYSAFFAATSPNTLPTPSASADPDRDRREFRDPALTRTSTATPGPTDTPVPPTPVPPTATQALVAPPPTAAAARAAAAGGRVAAASRAADAYPGQRGDARRDDQALEEAWVTVTVDGEVEFAAVMDAGDILEGEAIEIYTRMPRTSTSGPTVKTLVWSAKATGKPPRRFRNEVPRLRVSAEDSARGGEYTLPLALSLRHWG